MVDIINNSLFNWQINPLTALVRQFLTLGGVNEFGDIPAWTATGDFMFRTKAVIPASGGYLFASASSSGGRFAIQQDGDIFFSVTGATVTSGSGGPITAFIGDGILHEITLERVGSSVTVKVDDATVATMTRSGDFFVDSVGSQWGGATSIPFWGNVLSDISFEDTAGGDNRSYRMSQGRFGLGAYETDALATLGANTWDGGNLTAVNGGVVNTIVSGVSWDVSTPSGSPGNVGDAGARNPYPGLTTGKTYTVSATTTEPVNIVVLDGGFTVVANSDGAESVAFVATGTDRVYFCPRGTNIVNVSNPVIKEAPNAMLLNNIVAGDWGTEEP